MGVQRAIDLAHKTAFESHGHVFVLHEIVHNKSVVNDLEQKGVKSVDCVDEVDQGTLIISAHGASPDVIMKAKEKGLTVVDTTCPLVSISSPGSVTTLPGARAATNSLYAPP